MKIADSSMQMASVHAYAERHEKQESFQFWVGARPASNPTENNNEMAGPAGAGARRGQGLMERWMHGDEALNLSERARSLAPQKAMLSSKDKPDEEAEYTGDLETSLIKALIEEFTGRKIEIFKPHEVAPTEVADPNQPPAEGQPAQSEGWGLVYDYYESYQESESVSFSAQGKVRTADGQEISVDLSLSMSRSFFSEQQISIRAGDGVMKDPLVVNYAGTAAQLTQRSFSFDLDRDGRQDQIAFVQPGSGFLALDKNTDGKINDGGELFGPASGSGFNELAVHDEDGNQWIDESDAIYDQLRIWSKDASGADHLVGLGQAGVGAIYLGHQSTPYLLKDDNNQLLGQLGSSGVFLRENGSAGTIQEIDLVA